MTGGNISWSLPAFFFYSRAGTKKKNFFLKSNEIKKKKRPHDSIWYIPLISVKCRLETVFGFVNSLDPPLHVATSGCCIMDLNICTDEFFWAIHHWLFSLTVLLELHLACYCPYFDTKSSQIAKTFDSALCKSFNKMWEVTTKVSINVLSRKPMDLLVI